MEILDYLRQLNTASVVLRVFLAMAVGGFVGFEREKKHRPAGFRTYMLVALGAALTVMLSQYYDLMFHTRWGQLAEEIGVKTDVSRFAAQVINGVGFLGAGTILVTGRQEVKGLTTAAALWCSACIGLAVGAGFYEVVLIGFFLIVFIMRVLPLVEASIYSSTKYMNLFVEIDTVETLGLILNKLKQSSITLYNVDLDKEQHEHLTPQINALLNIGLPRAMNHTDILAELSTINGIITIEEV